VGAITIAMAHFTWFRYRYPFVPDYAHREELEVEKGLFIHPEEHIQQIFFPIFTPVVYSVL
jgi:hypothetical protein